MITLRVAMTASCAVAVVSPASAALFSAGLPAGAVVAFTPATVCDKLPGGWRDFTDADGRVVVGAAPNLPPSGPTPQAATDYWTRGVALKPGMVPRTPVTGAGAMLVTTPEITLNAAAAPGLGAALASPAPDIRLFGYRLPPASQQGSEALAVGFGAPGAAGKEPPDPVPVAPPYVALRYCVKS